MSVITNHIHILHTCEPFAKATYTLEGDGNLVLTAYTEISKLYASISTAHYPNTCAIIRKQSGGNVQLEQQLIAYANSCVQPAYHYFRQKFEGDLAPALAAFKSARLFDPVKISELNPVK